MLCALPKLHKLNIVHNDLHMSNVLVSIDDHENIKVMFIDFELSLKDKLNTDKLIECYKQYNPNEISCMMEVLFYQDPTHSPLIGNKLMTIENDTLFNNIKCIFKDENLINLKHIDYKKRLLLKQYGKYSKTIKSINSMRLKCSECPHPDGKKTMHSLRHATSVALASRFTSC